MTTGDTVFFCLLLVQVTTLAALVWLGTRLVEIFRRAQRLSEPSLREVRAVTEILQSAGRRAGRDGAHMVVRIRTLGGRLHARVERTRSLVRELRPDREAAARAVEPLTTLRRRVERAREVKGSLDRLSTAFRAARRAAAEDPDGSKD